MYLTGLYHNNPDRIGIYITFSQQCQLVFVYFFGKNNYFSNPHKKGMKKSTHNDKIKK